MINLGQYNELLALRKEDPGVFLVHPSEAEMGQEAQTVLLPNAYVPNGLELGTLLEVFVYLDSEDRIIATKLKPQACVGDFAFLEVKEVNQVGAFLDWGLAKDLLVPYQHQAQQMHEGMSYLVYVKLDEKSNRIIASSKVNQYLNNDHLEVEQGQEVELIVVNQTDLGYNLIVEGKHRGLVFKDSVFQELVPGQVLSGFVKQIRPDQKIDIVLQQAGVSSFEPNAQKIITYLQDNKGFSALGDKSDPELIYAELGISKKSFKKALGLLYKQKQISIENDGIRLK